VPDIDITIDADELGALAVRLAGAGRRAVPLVREVVAKAAQDVQDDLREKARGHATFPHFPRSITHDVRGLDAEIGPDKNARQGALGNILYFGTARTGPVLEHPARAVDRARPGFERALAEAGAQAIEDAR
jgi:hypothetical protein